MKTSPFGICEWKKKPKHHFFNGCANKLWTRCCQVSIPNTKKLLCMILQLAHSMKLRRFWRIDTFQSIINARKKTYSQMIHLYELMKHLIKLFLLNSWARRAGVRPIKMGENKYEFFFYWRFIYFVYIFVLIQLSQCYKKNVQLRHHLWI